MDYKQQQNDKIHTVATSSALEHLLNPSYSEEYVNFKHEVHGAAINMSKCPIKDSSLTIHVAQSFFGV